ncbi:YbaK/EbsC family protein [Mycobacterium asiaticum]|uniref:YbaK/EbsC family protein n=1 Tax=Mycobacterium asiaticum TaxID=1790 RepID=UPI0034633308
MPHEVVKYDHDARERSFGAEAVKALTESQGIAAEQIYKTLVIEVPGGLAVAVVPAAAKLSLKAAAAALGASKAVMADPAAVQRATGYVLGAVSPIGQRRQLPTVVDDSALDWERIFCSAGRRGWDVALSPLDLLRMTGGTTAKITS